MNTRRLPYDPALDGVRAVAVVAVMLYHAGVAWAPGGFLGVDIFFVLSGYLITTLLLREHAATGTIGLAAFWGRRARRLLPALIVVIAWVVVHATWIEPSLTDSGVRADIVATLLYVQNWSEIARDESYFALFSLPSPLVHTWSLAIEEQWYLIWPLAIAAWCRWGRHVTSGALWAAAAALASAGVMALVVDPLDPSRAYYGTDTRAQTLLVGAVLAFALHGGREPHTPEGDARLGDRSATPVGALGLVASIGVLAMVAFVHDDQLWMYRGGFLLAAVLGALVILSLRMHPAGTVSRALAAGPLPAVGRISYGLYLWHWPLYVLLTEERTGLAGARLVSIRLASTAAVAYASFRIIEQPIQRFRPGRSLLPTGLAVGALALALVGFVLVPSTATATPTAVRVSADDANLASATRSPARQALPTPTSGPSPAQSVTPAPLDSPTAETTPAITGSGEEPSSDNDVGSEPSSTPSPSIWLPVDAAPVVTPGAPIRTLLVGDSVYLDLVLAYPEAEFADRIHLTADVRLGCGTIPDDWATQCRTRLDSWRQSVTQDDPDVVLMGLSKWDAGDGRFDGELHEFGSAEHLAHVLRSWQEDVEVLGAGGARVVVVGLPCLSFTDAAVQGRNVELRTDPERTAAVNRLAHRFVEQSAADVAWLDLRPYTCPAGSYQEVVDGIRLHRDGVHFTEEAIPLVWAWLVSGVEQIAR